MHAADYVAWYICAPQRAGDDAWELFARAFLGLLATACAHILIRTAYLRVMACFGEEHAARAPKSPAEK